MNPNAKKASQIIITNFEDWQQKGLNQTFNSYVLCLCRLFAQDAENFIELVTHLRGEVKDQETKQITIPETASNSKPENISITIGDNIELPFKVCDNC